MSKVSVIIPAYNAEDSIAELISAVLENRDVLEVIVVNDLSPDGTATVVSSFGDPRVRLITNTRNGGAGYSRNVGMAAAGGDYFMFLDADDMIAHRAIDEVIYQMEQNDCDVMVFRYRFVTDRSGRMGGMLPLDTQAWDTLLGSADVRVFPLSQCDRLLFTVNFPWNKIVRAKLCRETGLRFSETRVHNDIYAHWHIYLHAAKIGMLNRYLIIHRVYEGQDQLSNVFTEKRFEVIKAFEDVEALFHRSPALKDAYYHWFLRSKSDILRWIHSCLPPHLRERYMALVVQSYEGYGQFESKYAPLEALRWPQRG